MSPMNPGNVDLETGPGGLWGPRVQAHARAEVSDTCDPAPLSILLILWDFWEERIGRFNNDSSVKVLPEQFIQPRSRCTFAVIQQHKQKLLIRCQLLSAHARLDIVAKVKRVYRCLPMSAEY